MKTKYFDINRLKVKIRPSTFCLFALTFILSPFTAQGQSFLPSPKSGTLAPGDYFNNAQILLTYPFSFSPSVGQHLYLYIAPNCAQLVTAPSQDKNYIMTSVPRTAGITDASQLTGRNACDLTQSVQYFDGLGRPIQSVQVMGSPTNKDLVQPMAYDAVGREITKYLPYVPQSVTADGSYKTDALTGGAGVFNFYNPTGSGTSGSQQTNGIVVIPQPFAQTGFEESPLNRVKEQGAPGDSWQLGSGHTVRMDYGTNDAAGGNISIWTINTPGTGAATTANYAAGQLFKTIATDENGNNTSVYKDKDGRVVYKRFATGTFIYYIYDDLGNLRYVIPPLPSATVGNPAVTMPSSFTESDDVFKNFFYGYHYDSRLRLIDKKVPGKDWEYVVYNVLDQPILTQDANQKAKGIWMMVKYDEQGRVIMTGEYTSSSDRATLQGLANSSSAFLWEWFYNGPTNYGYTHVTYPDIMVSSKVLTATYFDNYDIISNTAVNPSATNFPAPSAAIDTLNQMPTGLPVATLVNVLGTTDYLFAVTHYDTFGRSVKVFNQSYVGGSPAFNKYDTEESKYSFMSLPVSTVRKHYLPASTSPTLTINSWSRYDQMNRPLLNQQQFISSTVTGKINTLSKIDYNEIGQVKTKHLGSVATGYIPANSTFLQHINFRYNERGWLSTINDPTNLTDPDYSGVFDVFAERLDYDKSNNGYTAGFAAKYNGNISALSWQTKVPTSLVPTFTQEQKGYVFTYDPLNQMTNSVSQAATSGPGIYNEAVSYDELGNILTLIRKNTSGSTPLNSLTYNYTASSVRGNQLLCVTDVGTVSEPQSSTYTYNTNGSLITDSKKTITTPIVYNELGLPSLVTINTTAKTLTYKYDAAGNKLERITKAGAIVTEDRIYDDGIEYTGATGDVMDFVHTAEGRAVPVSGAYNYQYQVADHLGNIRALFADANNNSILTADEIIQFSDYYPFGREINYPISLSLTPGNNYKYNGKEFQNDLTEYDYGARFYDAVIGRWNVIDPMAEVNRKWTPYNYVVNNPVSRIDPDGMIDLNDFQTMDKSAEAVHQEYMDTKERHANELAAGVASRFGGGDCCQTQQDHTAGRQSPVDPRTFSHTSYKDRRKAETIAYNWRKDASNKAEREWRIRNHISPPRASGAVTQLFPENLIINAGLLFATDGGSELIEGTNVVYQGFDAAGVVRYVGITERDASIRFLEHQAATGTGRELLSYEVIDGATGLTRMQARVWEQNLINTYGLGGKVKQMGQLLNKINSIEKSKWLGNGIKTTF